MTEDNYHTESWVAKKELDKPADKYETIFTMLNSFITWIIDLIDFIREKLAK